MRKIRFNEHEIIAVLKFVEAGRTVNMCAVSPLSFKPTITIGNSNIAV